MKQFSLSEADHELSRLVRLVEESGEEVQILRSGRPVARITRSEPEQAADRKRKQAIARMIRRLTTGARLGGLRIDRDEIHER